MATVSLPFYANDLAKQTDSRMLLFVLVRAGPIDNGDDDVDPGILLAIRHTIHSHHSSFPVVRHNQIENINFEYSLDSYETTVSAKTLMFPLLFIPKNEM